MCTTRSLHRPQHSEGHHSFFFLDILTFSPLLTLYIAEPSWIQQAHGGILGVSTGFLGIEMHNLSRTGLRQVEGMYMHLKNGHTSWQSFWKTLHTTQRCYERVNEDLAVEFSTSFLVPVLDLFYTCWLVAWTNRSFSVAYEYISILRLWSTSPTLSPTPTRPNLSCSLIPMLPTHGSKQNVLSSFHVLL